MKKGNQRRIPMDKEFMKCNDLVYGYLQSVSNWNEGEDWRYVKKSEHSQGKIGDVVKLERKAVARAITKLKKVGAVEDRDGYYILPKYGASYQLIPVDTLQYMVHTLSQDCIKVYCILAYWDSRTKDTTFYKKGILTAMGSSVGGKQYDKIRDVLDLLQKAGFIQLEWIEDKKHGEDAIKYTLKSINKVVVREVK